jgi:hypothetical protein
MPTQDHRRPGAPEARTAGAARGDGVPASDGDGGSGGAKPPGKKIEVWLRGTIDGIAPQLQPVAHALIQGREDVEAYIPALTPDQLWLRPGGAASIGFHVRHAAGALDRLFTYARGESLSAEQVATARKEGDPDPDAGAGARLVEQFGGAVDAALAQLRGTDASSLLDARAVGRAQLPSSVLGLLFHAAEHTQRHMGQMITTIKIVTNGGPALK